MLLNSTHQRKIFIDGNSLSCFGAASLLNGQRYSTTMYGQLTGGKPAMFNYAIGSRRTWNLIDEFDEKIGKWSSPKDIVVMMEITNEARDGDSASSMYDNYVTYAQNAINNWGLITIMCTCPAGKLLGDPADTITRQQACNSLILADPSFCTAVADVGNAANLNTEAGITNGGYYHTDRLHLMNAGYDIVGGVVAPIVQPYL